MNKAFKIYFLVMTFFILTFPALQAAPQFFKAPDGWAIRYELLKAKNPKGTILYLPGRSCFLERSFEIRQRFCDLGYDVWSLDYRGQGKSGRILPNSQKVHIDTFDRYMDDLDAFMKEVVKPCDKVVVVGSSMGGEIGVLYAQAHPQNVKSLFLIAPLLDVYTPPIPRFLAPSFMSLACCIGIEEKYVIGHGDYTPSDPKKSWPLELVTGGVTYGWTKAMFQGVDSIFKPENLSKLKMPIQIIMGRKDTVIRPDGIKGFQKLTPQTQIHWFREGSHNLFKDEKIGEEVMKLFLQSTKISN